MRVLPVALMCTLLLIETNTIVIKYKEFVGPIVHETGKNPKREEKPEEWQQWFASGFVTSLEEFPSSKTQ